MLEIRLIGRREFVFLGKVGKFGNKREYDENINFGLASNERPFMLMGGTTLFEGEPRLNFLGVEICF